MSNQGPTTDTTVTTESTPAPKATGQFALDLNTLGTLRGKLRSTKATPAPAADAPLPVRVQATVVENKPLTTTVTVRNTNDLPKPVVKHATIRKAAAVQAPVPPVRKESLVNKNLGRPLPAAPKKQPVAADVPPPVPPRDDIAPVVPANPVVVPPAPPAPPAPPVPPAAPKMPAPAANPVGAKPALLFSAADLAGKKLKKTVTVDKSTPKTGKEVAHVAVQQPVAAIPGAVATPAQRAMPANVGIGFDDELKARLQKRTALKVQ